MGGTGFALGYRPALDGLRALAILLVIPYNWHWGVAAGYLGVDVFFVLSGFLITSLLLEEHHATGRIDLPAFWARRALRLLPALLLLLTALLLMSPSARANPLGPLLVLFYVGNWALALTDHGYEILGGLAHTWSLSVEEQFYLIWPPILLVLLRRGASVRALAQVAGVGVVLSFLLKWGLSVAGAPPLRIYTGTDTRADALLIGCLLALLARIPSRPIQGALRVPSWAGWLALVALVSVAAVIGPSDTSPWMQRGGFTLAALVAATVLAHIVASPGGAMARLFSAQPLVWTGRVSYGLYLWHPLVGAFSGDDRFGVHPALAVGLQVIALIGAVLFSWLAIERPALRLKRRWSRAGSSGRA